MILQLIEIWISAQLRAVILLMLTVTSVFAYSASPLLPSNYTLAGSDSTSVTGLKALVRGEGGDCPHQFLDEFRRSAIPDRMALANVQWIEGDAAIELLASEAVASGRPSTKGPLDLTLLPWTKRRSLAVDLHISLNDRIAEILGGAHHV